MPSIKAIVTGHTKGLGAGIAGELLARGVPVLGIARGHAPQLAQDYPGLLTEVRADLGDPGQLASWLAGDDLHDYLEDCPIVLLVNNAGTVQPVGALDSQDPMAVAMAVGLNVTAPLMLSAAVAKAQHPEECRILHVSSGAGRNAYPGWSIYCATKAALDHHARAVALDARPGVRICSLAPGVIDTGMQAEIRATPVQRFPMRARFADMKQNGQLRTPADCGRDVADYLLAPGFGEEPVDDLRG